MGSASVVAASERRDKSAFRGIGSAVARASLARPGGLPSASDSGPIPAPPTIVVSHPVFAPLAAAAAAQATSDAKVEIPEPPVAKAAFAALSEVFPQGSQFVPIPQAVPQVQPETDPPCHEPTPSPQKLMDDLLNCNVDIRTIDLKTVSVATALRHASIRCRQ